MMHRISRSPTRGMKMGHLRLAVFLLVEPVLALLATPAFAVLGNCGQKNAACTNEGVACVVEGQAGICTTKHTEVATYCFCSVNGKQLDETDSTGSSGNPIPLAPATVTFS